MASSTTTQTALCIIPPNDVWEQIQSIRSKHDRAYPRWMPHINLIYPFVAEKDFDTFKLQLEPWVNQRKPFQITFDQSSFDYFKQKKTQCTYHLRPKISSDVLELQRIIQNQLSNVCKVKHDFEAHLTLGQTSLSTIGHVITDMKTNWKTIEFTVDRIYMISRENHPDDLFTIKNEILLLDHNSEFILTAISNPTRSFTTNYLCIMLPGISITNNITHALEKTFCQMVEPFRIVLNEYENDPITADFRLKIESIRSFMLRFESDSIGFDSATSRLFLRPICMDSITQLNLLDTHKYDGTVIIGVIQKDDFDRIRDRFIKSFSDEINEIIVDRIHLLDSNNSIKFVFRLKPH